MPRYILNFKGTEPRPIEPGPRRVIVNGYHKPDMERQVVRIGPRLNELEAAFNNHVLELHQDVQGLDPEFVLVFEVVGGVNNFINAAKRIGLEWMGEADLEGVPDEDFYSLDSNNERTTAKVAEKIYLALTNRTAMLELLRLWKCYERGEKFQRGFTAIRDVFGCLRNIRRWNVEDRFLETGIKEILAVELENNPNVIRFEIELWYHNSLLKQEEAENYIRHLIDQMNGRVLVSKVYKDICYHGLIAECPAAEISSMLANHEHDLLQADCIQWIRATGQVVSVAQNQEVENTGQEQEQSIPTGEPIIALLDGLPMQNHQLLAERLEVNDADSLEDGYLVSKRLHGTAMSSLIIHGDMARPLPCLDSKLYVRPILKYNGIDSEALPDNMLFVDVLHRAILEIVNDERLRNSIRIVNLSIGNTNRPFLYSLSPEARMLDYLAEKYNLLFLVSSGNYNNNLYMDGLKGPDYDVLTNEQKQHKVYEYIWTHQLDMRIISPSESINSICVGALHNDFSTINTGYVHNPIQDGFPASYSRYGGGYARSVKPDIVNDGGRLVYNYISLSNQDVTLRVCHGSGQKVASPGKGTNGVVPLMGTSNSTALTSRLAAELLKLLQQTPELNIPRDYESIALKAMLVHCSSWGVLSELVNYVPQIPRKKKDEVLRWIGYGKPNLEMASFATDQRVTLLGYAKLRQNQEILFDFPLPKCLIAQAVKKRLTITLAWFSPTSSNSTAYKMAKLYFDADTKQVVQERINSDNNAAKRGTVQHEIFEGTQASTYIDGSTLTIKVGCKKEKKLEDSVRFVLMASLEVAPETHLPIYQEVETRLRLGTRLQI